MNRRVGIDARRLAYTYQRSAAGKRGIEWQFTFESWLAVWMESGKFGERGRKADNFVMARIGDVGPYSPGNVRIITATQNLAEAHKNKPMNQARIGRGKGWTKVGARFQVCVRHKYIGLFDSEQAATAARNAAIGLLGSAAPQSEGAQE